MTRICPKCHYARKPSDEAPEWQCPSCQVAYAKAADLVGMQHLPRRPERTESESAGAGPMKWVVLAAILCTAAVLGSAMMKGGKRASQTGEIIGTAQAGQPEVVMYSTSWCGYCRSARNFFQANGIQYVELDIEKSSQANSEHKRLGGRGVPLITVGDDVIKGYSQQRLEQLLGPWMTKS